LRSHVYALYSLPFLQRQEDTLLMQQFSASTKRPIPTLSIIYHHLL